jgi:hypothetical protein
VKLGITTPIFLSKNALQKSGKTVVTHVTAVGHQVLDKLVRHVLRVGEILLQYLCLRLRNGFFRKFYPVVLNFEKRWFWND